MNAAAELTAIPANANPADFNRIVRMVLVSSWTNGSMSKVELQATTEAAAKQEASHVRATLTIVPGFSGCRLMREVRYDYNPYCAEKHDRATF